MWAVYLTWLCPSCFWKLDAIKSLSFSKNWILKWLVVIMDYYQIYDPFCQNDEQRENLTQPLVSVFLILICLMSKCLTNGLQKAASLNHRILLRWSRWLSSTELKREQLSVSSSLIVLPCLEVLLYSIFFCHCEIPFLSIIAPQIVWCPGRVY